MHSESCAFIFCYVEVLIKNKKRPKAIFKSLNLARPTGFEPAISSVTGRRTRPTIPRAHH